MRHSSETQRKYLTHAAAIELALSTRALVEEDGCPLAQSACRNGIVVRKIKLTCSTSGCANTITFKQTL